MSFHSQSKSPRALGIQLGQADVAAVRCARAISLWCAAKGCKTHWRAQLAPLMALPLAEADEQW